MLGADTESVERCLVLGRAVAFVPLEAVAGMAAASSIMIRSRVTLATIEAAAIDSAAASPPTMARARRRQLRQPVAVDQREPWRHWQLRDRR